MKGFLGHVVILKKKKHIQQNAKDSLALSQTHMFIRKKKTRKEKPKTIENSGYFQIGMGSLGS